MHESTSIQGDKRLSFTLIGKGDKAEVKTTTKFQTPKGWMSKEKIERVYGSKREKIAKLVEAHKKTKEEK